MIHPLTEHGLALQDRSYDLERLCARQQAAIPRQASLLKRHATLLIRIAAMPLLLIASLAFTAGAQRVPGEAQASGPESVDRLGGPADFAQAVTIDGTTLYTGRGSLLQVYELGDPARPECLNAGLALNGTIEHIGIMNEIVLAFTSSDTIYVIDANDPSRLALLSSWSVDRHVNGLAVAGTHVFIAEPDALSVHDLRDPRQPVEIARLPAGPHGPGFVSIAVEGDHAYLTEFSGLLVVDISRPSAPRQVGRFRSVDDDYIYVWAHDEQLYLLGYDLHILDVSDPSRPLGLGRFQPFRYPTNLAVRGNLAYIAMARWEDDVQTELGGVEIVDLSDPNEPALRGRAEIPADVHDLAIGPGHAYLTAGDAGLLALDVSDPDKPRLTDESSPCAPQPECEACQAWLPMLVRSR